MSALITNHKLAMTAILLLLATMASGEPLDIPAWRTVSLYPRAALERLDARFDLSPIREGPRLTIVADRAEGIFDVVLEEASRKETLPVVSVSRGAGPRERTLVAGPRGACVRVALAGDAPFEAEVQGMDGGLDQTYVAMARVTESSLRVYTCAEQELVEEYLPGTWDVEGRRLEAAPAGGRPAAVRLGGKDFFLSIPRAPSGTDVLLLPRDGSAPSFAIRLRGPDSFHETPVRCRPDPKGGYACEVSGPDRAWRRAGARLNR